MLDLHFIAQHIENQDLRDLTCRLLDEADPEFWKAPASSTGKHHPYFDQGCMGLVRHTALVTVMAVDALRRYYDEPPREMVDVMLCAGLLHDLCKNGYPQWGEWTLKEHPQITAQRVLGAAGGDPGKLVEWACFAIAWHYGAWTVPEPRSPLYFMAQAQMGGTECCAPGPDIAALCLQEADFHGSRRYVGVPDRAAMVETLAPYRPLEV